VSSRFEVWYEIMEVHNFLVLCKIGAYGQNQIHLELSTVAATFVGFKVDLQLINHIRQNA
jgi:hypothetical protein